MSRIVPFFDYPKLWTDNKKNYFSVIDSTASSGGFIMQKDLEEFERNLASFTGSNYSVGVGNATDAMEIFLEAIGISKGDEIIISSHTMLATASAIKVAGGIPVPVDIGKDNLISIDSIKEAITSNTVGIMPTQLNGRVCDMDQIINIAQKNGLFVVEDAAQALGARYKGKHAGTFGLASCISFFPAKVLGCFGDAGGILVNDENLYHQIYQIHDHGRDVDGEVKRWGRNSRLDNLQAAILNYKLNNYEHVIKRRREVAQMYEDRLADLEELQLPESPSDSSNNFDVYQNYELTADNRDGLKEYLHKKNIGTLIQWGGKGIHHFEQLGFNQTLPNTDKFFKKCIMLPMNMFIEDDDINYVCETIKSFYRKMIKRIFDIIISLIGLIITIPVLVFVCILVWRYDKHSPFYIAPRVGINGTVFNMIKLRSMIIEADKTGVDSTSNNDFRITPIGHKIRKYKLDELTQLWNVLLGDMSLVGPRPNVKSETNLYTKVEKKILSVKPGITDFASIIFSDEGKILENKKDPDLAYNQLIRPWKSRLAIIYINNKSVFLDIKIIIYTIMALFSKSTALNWTVKNLEQLNVEENIISISKRDKDLYPYPPPGSNKIVGKC